VLSDGILDEGLGWDLLVNDGLLVRRELTRFKLDWIVAYFLKDLLSRTAIFFFKSLSARVRFYSFKLIVRLIYGVHTAEVADLGHCIGFSRLWILQFRRPVGKVF
jgi:hypothetical protein